MFPDTLIAQCKHLLSECQKKSITVATAESCTGGLISALMTEIPGSSAVFERGFITYSNASKSELLGVSPAILAEHGAVSEVVAAAMASGARQRTKTQLTVAATGIAGPDGGSKEKPVGTVCIAVSSEAKNHVATYHFNGNRSDVRLQSVAKALEMLSDMLNSSSFVSVA